MIGDEKSLGENVMDGFVIGAVAALVGAIIDLVVTNMTLKDNLDSKSEWRKELFGVASSDKVSFESINILRATLRYRPKKLTKPKDILMPLIKVRNWLIGFIILTMILETIFGLPMIMSVALFFVVLFFTRKLDSFKKKLGYTKIYKVTARGSSSDFYASTYTIEIGDSQYDLNYSNCEAEKIFESEIDVFNLFDLVNSEFEFNHTESRQDNYGKMNIDNIPLFYFNFDSITKTIIDFCAKINAIEAGSARKVKIYTMYMLKHHWEELSVPNYRFIKKIEIRIANNGIIKELIKTMNDENNNVFGVAKTLNTNINDNGSDTDSTSENQENGQ